MKAEPHVFIGTFRGNYAPGGLTTAAARRERCRRAGRRSGVVRRQLAELHGPRRRQRVAQLDPEAFERAYREMCEREGLAFDRRGLNSTHVLYVALMTRYRVQGNGFETTNAQTCAAMASRDRARCRRTVQRLRRRLQAMGVLDFHHVKRSGSERRPGELDSLRVVCLHARRTGANVTLRSWSEPALKGRRLRREALSAPPSAADEVRRRFAAPGTEDREVVPDTRPVYASEDERRLAFLAMCERYAPTLLAGHEAELARLRRTVGGGSGQSISRTASIAAEGER